MSQLVTDMTELLGQGIPGWASDDLLLKPPVRYGPRVFEAWLGPTVSPYSTARRPHPLASSASGLSARAVQEVQEIQEVQPAREPQETRKGRP